MIPLLFTKNSSRYHRHSELPWWGRTRCLRIGAVLIPTPLTKAQWERLIRLGLIHEDDDKHVIGWTIGRLLDAAEPLSVPRQQP